MKSTPLIYAKNKTICPHCQGKSYYKLTSHDTGGKCFKCDKYDPPFPPQIDADAKIKKSARGNNPNALANLQKIPKYVPQTAKERGEKAVKVREHIYKTPDGAENLLKIVVMRYSDGEKYCPQEHWNGTKWESGGVQSNKLTLYHAHSLTALQSSPQAIKDSTTVYVPDCLLYTSPSPRD